MSRSIEDSTKTAEFIVIFFKKIPFAAIDIKIKAYMILHIVTARL